MSFGLVVSNHRAAIFALVLAAGSSCATSEEPSVEPFAGAPGQGGFTSAVLEPVPEAQRSLGEPA